MAKDLLPRLISFDAQRVININKYISKPKAQQMTYLDCYYSVSITLSHHHHVFLRMLFCIFCLIKIKGNNSHVFFI